jgi:hypothetical protein
MKPIVPWLALALFAVAAPLLALVPGIVHGLDAFPLQWPFLRGLPGDTYGERVTAIAACYVGLVVPAIIAANVIAGIVSARRSFPPRTP